jgi:hypothetical protein
MKDNEDRWDEYIEGALFAINTNQSTTTKYSPFYMMFGRNPRFPIEAEKGAITPTGSDDIAQLMQDLSSEIVIREHVEETSRMKDALFPIVDSNIQKAQEKQKIQYQNKKGQPVCQFKAGDAVLLRNMLQKTKKGHKLEDQWLGPYEVTEVIADRGVCKLLNPSTKKQVKQQSIKNLRPYKRENTTDKHQQLNSATQQSQGTLSEGMSSNEKNLKRKDLGGNESDTKTPEEMQSQRVKPNANQIHEMQSDGTKPDSVQSNVKQSETNQSTAMPHFSSNGNDSYVTSLEDNNPPESLPYLEKQQNSGTAIQG